MLAHSESAHRPDEPLTGWQAFSRMNPNAQGTVIVVVFFLVLFGLVAFGVLR